MLDAVFSAWRARLVRFCTQVLRNRDDAEEVVQDVFAQLVGNGTAFDLSRQPEVLLFRLARHRCIDLRRKRRAQTNAELDPTAREDDAERSTLEDALASLLPEEREVLVLTALDGLGYREVAAILKCSLGTVAARRYAAIGKLQRRLAP